MNISRLPLIPCSGFVGTVNRGGVEKEAGTRIKMFDIN